MAPAAVRALQALPSDQAASVAAAIEKIGKEEGTHLGVPDAGDDPLQVMVPDDDQAPVVVYQQRPKLEGGRYLVTALLERSVYNTYADTGEPGFLETPLGKAILFGAAGLALAYLLGRSGTGGVTP
jgi:hypothetical protein